MNAKNAKFNQEMANPITKFQNMSIFKNNVKPKIQIPNL